MIDKPKNVLYNDTCGGVAQLVRAFGSHPRGHGFEPPRLHQKITSHSDVIFLSKPQDWHIIRRQAVYYPKRRCRFGISSRRRRVFHLSAA